LKNPVTFGLPYIWHCTGVYRFAFNGMENDNELKGAGNSLDYGARLYDPRLGKWLACDPHAAKYPGISPYTFVINCPISAIDPDGKDVVFLIAKDGAGKMGHMAALIQDKEGQWYYVTQGGGIPEGTGMGSIISSRFPGGFNLQKLNTTDVEVAIATAKQDASNSPYTETVQLKTTNEQDEQIYKNALELEEDYKTGKQRYQLITNNCVDADQCTVQKKTGIKLPLDIDPRPNKYFQKLKSFVEKSNAKFEQENQRWEELKEKVKFKPPVATDDGSSEDVKVPESDADNKPK
jgi:RHS repeat-associated protein